MESKIEGSIAPELLLIGYQFNHASPSVVSKM